MRGDKSKHVLIFVSFQGLRRAHIDKAGGGSHLPNSFIKIRILTAGASQKNQVACQGSIDNARRPSSTPKSIEHSGLCEKVAEKNNIVGARLQHSFVVSHSSSRRIGNPFVGAVKFGRDAHRLTLHTLVVAASHIKPLEFENAATEPQSTVLQTRSPGSHEVFG